MRTVREDWHLAYKIANAVNRYYHLGGGDVLTKTRIRRITEARLVAVWLVHTRTDLDKEDIASMFHASKSIVSRAEAFVSYCRRQQNRTYWMMGPVLSEIHKYIDSTIY